MTERWYRTDCWNNHIERIEVVKATDKTVTVQSSSGKSTSRYDISSRYHTFHRSWGEVRQFLRDRAFDRLCAAEEAAARALQEQVQVNMIPETEPEAGA